MSTSNNRSADVMVESPTKVARWSLEKDNGAADNKEEFCRTCLPGSDWDLQILFQDGEESCECATETEFYQALSLAPSFLSRQTRATLWKRSRTIEEDNDRESGDNGSEDEVHIARRRVHLMSSTTNADVVFPLEGNNCNKNDEIKSPMQKSYSYPVFSDVEKSETCPCGSEETGVKLQRPSPSVCCDHTNQKQTGKNTYASDCGNSARNNSNKQQKNVPEDDPRNTCQITQTKSQKNDSQIRSGNNNYSRNPLIPTHVDDPDDEKRLSLDSTLRALNIPKESVKQTRSTFPSRIGKRLARRFISPTQNNVTMLQYAVIDQDFDTVKKILSNSDSVCNINFLYPPGVTILHQACVLGDFSIVKLLIQKGADVRLKTWRNLSPTKLAAIYGHFDIAQLLLLMGADGDDVRNGFQID